jgi:hypothetical protein
MKELAMNEAIINRMLEKVVPGATDDECWGWDGGLSQTGMGCNMFFMRLDGAPAGYQACRVSWAHHHGTDPEGFFIRHTCGNHGCANPRHLLAEAHETAPTDRPVVARRTECVHGHKLTGGNLYVSPKGHRSCRRCTDARREAYLARRNGLAAA